MRWRALLVILFSYYPALLFAQEATPAEFPGGIPALQRYVATNLNYPVAAQQKGIEGMCYISFEVTEDGYVDPATVKTVISLDPECDAEAERIIKALREKWKPALKNGIPIRSKFIQPVKFVFTDHKIQFRTVVIEKQAKNTSRSWSVYADAGMSKVIGSVDPGDSVTVFSWKPWLYVIQRGPLAGFISWRALHITPELRAMARELETKSDSLLNYQVLADSLKRFAKLGYWSPVLKKDALSESWKYINDSTLNGDAHAFLRVYTSDNDIQVGECTVVNLSFYVNDNNTIRMQFNTLAEQLNEIIHGPLGQENCWVANGYLETITGADVKINGSSFSEYRLYSAAYCPMKAGQVVFKPVILKVAKMKNLEIETLLPFTSTPLKINVRPANPVRATEAELFKLTGNFVLSDSVHARVPGLPLRYSITLKGIGLTFPVQPPAFGGKDFTAHYVSTEEVDTIINDTYYSSKTFTWQLYLKEGTHTLWSKPVFSAADLIRGNANAYTLNRILQVSTGQGNDEVPVANPLKNHFILMDVSQSMMMEDYKPFRLAAVKKGVRSFLTARKTCDVGLIRFSGSAAVADIAEPSVCYSAYNIWEIDNSDLRRGTSIGDAVWLAIHSAAPSVNPRKIVLIGDGDDISSYLHLRQAAALAKKKNMIIYTIGIGHTGMVPFGRDQEGNVLKVHSTFTDTMFKQLAAQTGGQYFYAESSEDVTRFLTQILGQ